MMLHGERAVGTMVKRVLLGVTTGLIDLTSWAITSGLSESTTAFTRSWEVVAPAPAAASRLSAGAGDCCCADALLNPRATTRKKVNTTTPLFFDLLISKLLLRI